MDHQWLVNTIDRKVTADNQKLSTINSRRATQQKEEAPVMDYRALNKCVDAFTTNADVFVANLCECHQQGPDVTILKPRKPYLQVHVHQSV